PEVIAAQNGVLELLLANHPLDCPICDKGGECPLQDNTFRYGPGTSRFTEEKRHKEKAFPLGEQIVLDRERCIMCYRCVRFHQEIPGDEALAAVARGSETEIATLTGEPYSSMFAGNTIELCPVAVASKRCRARIRVDQRGRCCVAMAPCVRPVGTRCWAEPPSFSARAAECSPRRACRTKRSGCCSGFRRGCLPHSGHRLARS